MVGSGSSGAAIAGRLAESGASVIVRRGRQERREVPGQEARDDRPDALGARDQEDASTGASTRCRRSTSSTARCRSRAARSSAARARSTAWSTSAATAPTSTPGPPRATPAGTPTASTRRTSGWRTSRTARTTSAAPAARSRSPVNKTPQEGSLQFLQATADTIGCKILDDYNGGVAGGRQPDAAERRRRPALQRLARLHPPPRARRPSQLQSETLTRKVVIENGRAVGIEVQDVSKKGNGAKRTIRAGKEVILSAGFVGSAQILMLSGIGHAQHLQRPRHRRRRGPAGRRQPARPHVPRADVPRARERRTCAARALVFAKGVRQGGRSGPGTTFLANSVFEVLAFLKTSQADRRPGPAAAPAAVGLRLAQPGRADPPRRRQAHLADGAVDADLPAEPRHAAARVEPTRRRRR